MHGRTRYTPLTEHEQQFAAENHYLVEWYLRKQGLDPEEWYDTVIFRYLLAVKSWFQKPQLHKYKFSTIAVNGMRSAIGNERKKQKQQIKTVSLDTAIPGTEERLTYMDTITSDNLELIYIGGEEMKISYNVKVPDRRRIGVKSDEVLAVETFMNMKGKQNMCFEYGSVDEAKSKCASLQTYRRKEGHTDLYEVFRKEIRVYVVRVEKEEK